jgi:hypothetical protein
MEWLVFIFLIILFRSMKLEWSMISFMDKLFVFKSRFIYGNKYCQHKNL